MSGKYVAGAGNRWIAGGQILAGAVVLAAFGLAALPQQVGAQAGERSGKDVVSAVCANCHGTGANGAPKIGDSKAWAALASRGLSGLSKNALSGIRKMPSHGGNMTLTDTEIERAITYMVNQSGGKWVEPVSRTTPASERSAATIVKTYCAKCHETGVGGAPKIGDSSAWTPRVKQGFDTLTRSAINGHGGMPPRGGAANLTDAEVRAAIVYMFNPAFKPAAAADKAPAAAARPDPNHQLADGMDIYFGISSAESIRKAHPGNDAESRMHGGIPSGSGYYHVNISLLDVKTKSAVKDAQIELTASDPVMGGQTKPLEAITMNNSLSYGNYFQLQGSGPYTISAKIRKPGSARVSEVKFTFRK